MKSILFIACNNFPPEKTSGVKRSKAVCSYLKQSGYNVSVLALKTGNEEFVKDKDVEGLEVFYVKSSFGFLDEKIKSGNDKACNHKKFSRNFFIKTFKKIVLSFLVPDHFVRWINPALKKANEIWGKIPFEFVYSTGPSFSSHMVGYYLKKRFKIFWVAEFRDPWPSSFGYHNFIASYFDKRLRDHCLKSADKIVVVAEDCKEFLMKDSGINIENKCQLIRNGYDKEFNAPNEREKGKIKIVHTGRFYGMRTPVSFLKNLKKIQDEKPEICEKIELLLVGEMNPEIRSEIDALNIENIKILEFVEGDEALKYQSSSDILLVYPGLNTYSVPGKLYEYFAAGKKILVISENEDESVRLVKGLNRGWTVNPQDFEQIKNWVYEILNYDDNYWEKHLDSKEIAEFSRIAQLKGLSEVLEI